MTFLLLADLSNSLLGFLMGFLSLFLIMLILIQRGKGGGLTGALGGPGGQSAFGSKAGDTFTLVTIVVASIWGFTCAFAMWLNVPATDDPGLMSEETTMSQGPGGDQNSKLPVTKNDLSGLSEGLTLGGVDPAPTDPATTTDPAPTDPAPTTDSVEAPTTDSSATGTAGDEGATDKN